MSHSFYIRNIEAPSISQIREEMGGKDIHFVEGYPSPVNDKWPDGLTYIYLEKESSRAIEVEFSGGTFQVRIFAASSPNDYELATALTAAVAKLCKADIEPEDNEKMSLSEYKEAYDSTWIKEHSQSMLSMVLSSQMEEPERVLTISSVQGSVKIGPRFMGQLMSHKDNISKEFFDRIKKLNYINFEDIYQSVITVFGNQEGDRGVRLSTYTEGVPTLLQDRGTLVALTSESDLEDKAEKTNVTIPLYKLPEIVGEKAKWLSEEFLLLPGMSGDEWASFVEKARSIHVDDIFEAGFDLNNDPYAEDTNDLASNAPSGELIDSELSILSYAPMVVFFIVASADGSIDKKEINAFRKALVKGIMTDSETLLKVAVLAVSEFETMITQLLNKEVNVQQTLLEITSIINTRLPEDEANQFKKGLLDLGVSVASASGGFLGMFGSKIDKHEKQALDALKAILKIEE